MEHQPVAAVGGSRLRWNDVSQAVRAALEAEFGARVVAADSREGGFSPALASVLTFDDGRTVFAKAVSVTRNDFTYDAIRTERRVLGDLPGSVPAPNLRWGYDDGEWTALVTEAIPGRNPVTPWLGSELARFLAAATVLAGTLMPAPIDAPAIWAEAEFQSWSSLSEHAHRFAPWIGARVGELARLDAGWPEATRSDGLMHGDFRGDNVVLRPDSGFVVVDWPSVRRGAPWLDLLCALPSVTMHGGGDPEELWAGHPLARSVDPDAVNAALAGFAGFVLARSLEPPVPLLPTIRAFQRVQGEVALDWLFRRLG